MSFEMPPLGPDAWGNLLERLGLLWFLAMIGRLAWHVTQVRGGKRRFFGWELAYEMPLAAFCGLASAGLGSFLGFEGDWLIGFVGIMSYLGPGGLEALFWRVVEGAGVGPAAGRPRRPGPDIEGPEDGGPGDGPKPGC